jgi:hypothetical protein
MAKVSISVELSVNKTSGLDPVDLERAIAAEGRRAARELYLRVLRVFDDEATGDASGIRQRREPRWVATLFGRVRILRYRVRRDGTTFHPLDGVLGLDRHEASAALRHVIRELEGKASFRTSARVIEEITGESFSYQDVRRVARSFGQPHE